MKKRENKLSEIIVDFTIEEINNMFEEIKEIRKKYDKRTIEETKRKVKEIIEKLEKNKKMGG